mgnify:CR=1 FL=1
MIIDIFIILIGICQGKTGKIYGKSWRIDLGIIVKGRRARILHFLGWDPTSKKFLYPMGVYHNSVTSVTTHTTNTTNTTIQNTCSKSYKTSDFEQ